MIEQFRDEQQYHNRTYIGQIIGVREDDGLMTVRLTSGATHKMVIPITGMSGPVNDADGNLLRSGARASWMRYMPQDHDYVKVAFGPDNRPEAVGYATWGDLESERGPLGNLGGYAFMTEMRKRNVPGMETFIKLRQGEWDMRSSGNAYIYGTRFGTLTLAGGGVQLNLQKEQSELNGRSGLYRFESLGSFIHFGDVKRQGLTDFQPVKVGGSGKEFDLQISEQTTAATQDDYYRVRMGDLWDDTGDSQLVSDAGSNLRFREEVFDGGIQFPGSDPAYVREVDADGNVFEKLGSSATQQTLTGASVTEFSREGYLSLRYEASSSIDLVAPSINLGSAALEPAIKGQTLVAALQALTVLTPVGPSSVPVNSAAYPLALSGVVNVG